MTNGGGRHLDLTGVKDAPAARRDDPRRTGLPGETALPAETAGGAARRGVGPEREERQ